MQGDFISCGIYQPEDGRVEIRFERKECSKEVNGHCPIEDLCIWDLYCAEDLSDEWEPFSEGGEPWCCIGIAQGLIKHGAPEPVELVVDMKKGRIACSKGRHVCCVAGKMNSRNAVKLSVQANVRIN